MLTNAPGYGRKSSKQFHRKSGRALQFTKPFSEYQPILSERPTERLDGIHGRVGGLRKVVHMEAVWEFLKLQYDSTTNPGGEKFPIFKQLNQKRLLRKSYCIPNHVTQTGHEAASEDQKGYDFTAEQAPSLPKHRHTHRSSSKDLPEQGRRGGTEVLLATPRHGTLRHGCPLNGHLAEEIEATVAENHEFGPASEHTTHTIQTWRPTLPSRTSSNGA